MNATYRSTLVLLLAALTLAAAPAHAGPGYSVDATKETDTLEQLAGAKIKITEVIEFQYNDDVVYVQEPDPNWEFQLQTNAQNVAASFTVDGTRTPIDASKINRTSGTSTHDRLRVDTSGLLQTGNESYAIQLDYEVPSTYDHILSITPATLVVYTTSLDGFESTGTNVGSFAPTGDGRYHATQTAPPANHRFSVTFQQASAMPGAARDLTPYLWALAGLVLGFLVAAYLARRGKIGQANKKFKKGGTMESRDMLEARRRTLMAALKELELAHDAKEIPDAAYGPLKEEYKAQAVRVMRTLDEKKEPPT